MTSTGTTAAALTTDFGNPIAAITTSGRALTWIMRPTTLARVALILGGAASDVPRTLFGIPIIASGNSPQQVTLVDAGEIGTLMMAGSTFPCRNRRPSRWSLRRWIRDCRWLARRSDSN